jgi:hypothetical protein
MKKQTPIAAMILLVFLASAWGKEPHSLWMEAESFGPLHGSNYSFQPVAQTTKGSWSLAGPGVAAEWLQGGESEFLSVAARADEAGELAIGREIELPAAGAYTLWVRYGDYRRKEESFGVRVKQGEKVFTHIFGVKPVADDLDPHSLLWGFSFVWDSAPVELAKGPAHIELYTTGPTEARRHVDLLFLTTDASFHPTGREKPDLAAWKVLRAIRKAGMKQVEGLSRQKVEKIPAAWAVAKRPPAFLWNSGDPWWDQLHKEGGIDFPFGVDPPLEKPFIAAFAKTPAPVYSNPLSGPAWHISNYPKVFATGSPFLKWLDTHPQARFCLVLNYGDPNWPKDADKQAVYSNLRKYAGRCVGYIAGESIAHTGVDNEAMYRRIKAAKTRGEILDAMKDANTASVIKKFSGYYGKEISAAQAWDPVIPCLSGNNESLTHALCDWGVGQIGHENTANSPTLARRLAFLRGAARQFGKRFVDYQSINFGDAATMFSRQNYIYPASDRYILDNSYDAFAGAGTSWLARDYLLWLMAGTDAFYNEQGIDLFWRPGGVVAGDTAAVQLSPKGKVAETMITLAHDHPRGTQFTPIAFLLDEAHGWSQERFHPGAWQLEREMNPSLLTPGRHEASIRGWFDVAYYPAPETQSQPADSLKQTYVNGIFGDIFDVIVTAPGHGEIVKTYPVLIAAGEVPVSDEWGKALAGYVDGGGTLVVCADQFSGAGVSALKLPAFGQEAEADTVVWKMTGESVDSNLFRYRGLNADGARVLATTADGKALAVDIDRGKGRMILVGIPLGLGIDQRPTPLLSFLMNHLAQGLVPVRVEGDVEWALNRADGLWILTLLNNRGTAKPQHGMVPSDPAAAQEVTIRTGFAIGKVEQWLAGEAATVGDKTISVRLPPGGIRVLAMTEGK